MVRRAELAAVWLAALLAASPFAFVRWVPLMDYPQHLAAAAAWGAGPGDPGSAYFVIDLARSQYVLVYAAIAALAPLLGIELAGKAVVMLIVGGIPLALAYWLSAHRRSPLAAVPAGLMALQMPLFFGFLNFWSGVPLALLALGLAARLQRRPRPRQLLAFAVVTVLAHFAHPLTYGWMAITCALQFVLLAPGRGVRANLRGLGAALLGALPSILLMLDYVQRSEVLRSGQASARLGLSPAPPMWTERAQALAEWRLHSASYYRDGSGDWVLDLFLLAVGLLVAARIGGWMMAESRSRSWLRPLRLRRLIGRSTPELLVAFAVVLYFEAPRDYSHMSIAPRLLPIALVLLPALGAWRGRPPAWLAVLAIVVGVGVGVQASTHHAGKFRAVEAETGDLESVLGATEPGHTLLGVSFGRGSETTSYAAFWHHHMYYQALVGGLAAFSFTELPQSPIAYREGRQPPPTPGAVETLWDLIDHPTLRDYYDYLLIRTGPRGEAPLTAFPSHEICTERPGWILWARAGELLDRCRAAASP